MSRARDEREIYGKPGHLIRRLQQIAVAIFVTETEGFEITPVQYSALVAVRNHPGIDQTTLMEIIAFDRSTIGEVIGRLEAKRLVKRVVASSDRRARTLFITSAGRRLLSLLTPRVNEAQDKIVGPLTPAERTAFMQMMKRLVDLNNDHSRVPLKLADRPKQRRRKTTKR
jgi:MarR family transcriptional regulator, lower aerobic nicotinate degradation pathway regulator